MKLAAPILLTLAIASPAWAQDMPEAHDPALMAAIQAEATCLHYQVLQLDDHTSDASTIASAAMGVCTPQINLMEREAARSGPMGANIAQANAQYEASIKNATIAMVLTLRARAKQGHP